MKSTTMNTLEMMIVMVCAVSVSCRRRRYDSSSSGESFDNFLYYQDIRHKKENVTVPPPPPPTPPMPVPYRVRPQPKPCQTKVCFMCCNDCGENGMSMNGNTQMNGIPQMDMTRDGPPPPFPSEQFQPQIQQNVPNSVPSPMQPPLPRRRKKIRPLVMPPMGARRDMTQTREHIKGLISRDEDIKKILKDLVRVTMQKVTLLENIASRRSAGQPQIIPDENDDDYSDGD